MLRTLQDVNDSVRLMLPGDRAALVGQRRSHDAARRFCRDSAKQTAAHGGWCLETMARDRLFGSQRLIDIDGGYLLPAAHVPADELVLQELYRLVEKQGYRSILDLGAGVGQYGHSLRSRYGDAVWYRGFDGAGDVENYTNGFVRYVDLTLPFALRGRAEWVISLEVGEHVPRDYELMFVRNVHAHACNGVVLSWACYGGHQHVNKRSNEYVIALFEGLGYRYKKEATDRIRQPATRERLGANRSLEDANRVYSWFARSVMVFERIAPLSCSSRHGLSLSRLTRA